MELRSERSLGGLSGIVKIADLYVAFIAEQTRCWHTRNRASSRITSAEALLSFFFFSEGSSRVSFTLLRVAIVVKRERERESKMPVVRGAEKQHLPPRVIV